MSATRSLPPKTLLDIFKVALKIQLIDEKVRGLLMSGRMAAVFYSPRGQEILAACMGVNLKPTDYLVTTYRGMHDQVAKGIPLRQLFAEYYGKATGTCKGKGGPMHITYPTAGIMVTTGVVGAGLPIANGLALASQLKGDGRVTVVTFGDGASNIGAFHESLNMASLWKLPVIFLCQNNGYGECTKYDKATAVANIADRAASYNMRGVTVDGNDAQAMHEAMREAVERARSGEGPTLLEAKTFRFMGHYFGDPGAYIPKEEYAAALARDPMPIWRANVLKCGAATEADLESLAKEINAEIDDALQFALDSAPPDVREIDVDIYAAGAHA
ncbi:pyruvate dehydrogenase E1 component subunit alpha [Steroidobacter agaridevorans]|uniref:Pyruvate dehydrogenase E1 component subunit alpha n=1 Tax=Steroidobacter agaridevorans TaxID=2695856 RepID=A0A829Y9V4_9GAMM|nr:thiamine pyrophosphate-dependent dehydrogenase E1 component subunit alpha [Steroidobacter agaridevorans]GFE79825.1 pyruvate dehydrogenase E1 component subunit alpha [Steroidobacter agaridevorans]GFE90206.1 pyruvate dehydrogenase E1 component subunit alpha [Steroidobacter agaridevorans]